MGKMAEEVLQQNERKTKEAQNFLQLVLHTSRFQTRGPHRGHEEQPGSGATFTLFLPTSDVSAASVAPSLMPVQKYDIFSKVGAGDSLVSR
jgi:hypothetical protein